EGCGPVSSSVSAAHLRACTSCNRRFLSPLIVWMRNSWALFARSPTFSHTGELLSIRVRRAGSTVVSPFSAFRTRVFSSSGVGMLTPFTTVMLVISFCIECRLEQHSPHIPPGVYLLVQCVKHSPFLTLGLGLSLTLDLTFSILRCT